MNTQSCKKNSDGVFTNALVCGIIEVRGKSLPEVTIKEYYGKQRIFHGENSSEKE